MILSRGKILSAETEDENAGKIVGCKMAPRLDLFLVHSSWTDGEA